MKVLISGSTGLIGSAFVSSWAKDGNEVVRLVRGAANTPDTIAWAPSKGILDRGAFEGVEGVVHLAGENIGSGRWTPAKKAAIRESRVRSTELLAQTMAELDRPPAVWVCASAIGYYGDRGDELLDEDSGPGEGFLPELCQAWEAACMPAVDRGIRVVNLRFGVVLSPHGGALKQMLPPFRLGLGGRIGSGKQITSWIALEDAVRAIRHSLEHPNTRGPVNATTPNPVTNAEFSKALGKALSRPAVVPVPATAIRLMVGEMADALLLSSANVIPRKLNETGFSFLYPELEAAFAAMLHSNS